MIVRKWLIFLTCLGTKDYEEKQRILKHSKNDNNHGKGSTDEKLFIVTTQNVEILAYHWSIKMYTEQAIGNLVCVLTHHWSFAL